MEIVNACSVSFGWAFICSIGYMSCTVDLIIIFQLLNLIQNEDHSNFFNISLLIMSRIYVSLNFLVGRLCTSLNFI
jgi:hypothetical protein